MTMERRLLPLIAMASLPSDGALMMEGADKRHDLAAPENGSLTLYQRMRARGQGREGAVRA